MDFGLAPTQSEGSFETISCAAERGYFKGLPTSFVLDDEEVDSLREVGRRLLRDSEAFQELLSEWS